MASTIGRAPGTPSRLASGRLRGLPSLPGRGILQEDLRRDSPVLVERTGHGHGDIHLARQNRRRRLPAAHQGSQVFWGQAQASHVELYGRRNARQANVIAWLLVRLKQVNQVVALDALWRTDVGSKNFSQTRQSVVVIVFTVDTGNKSHDYTCSATVRSNSACVPRLRAHPRSRRQDCCRTPWNGVGAVTWLVPLPRRAARRRGRRSAPADRTRRA